MTNLLSTFAARWKSDAALMAQPDPSHYSYNIRGGKGRNPEVYTGEIDSLRIRFNGRWGNYVFQMIHLFHVAEKLRAKRVYLLPTDLFGLALPIKLDGIEVRSVYSDIIDEDYELEGVFFSELPLGELLKDLTANRRSDLARRFIKPLMIRISPPTDILKPGSLAIHIRSGDIFEGQDGQGGSQLGGGLYVQPPLSFYQMVVEAAFDGGKGSVFIISENALNPVILPLTQILDRLGHSVSLRLNQSLHDDLAWLLAAPMMVFANGTIGIAIAMLSTELRDGYFFRHDGTGTTLPVEAYVGDHVRKRFVSDFDGDYIPVGCWYNTAGQRSLMRELSRSKLLWEDKPPMINVALNKPARQSSMCEYSSLNESKNAVNGLKTGSFAFHTQLEANPWWECELGGLFLAQEIIIYNRLEYSHRALSMQVLIWGEDDAWELLHDQRGRWFGGIDGCPAWIAAKGKPIRAIRVQLCSTEYLHLDQVEVLCYAE